MIKSLILVRHATAEDAGFGVKDFDRELVGKGLMESAVMGRWLSSKGFSPESYITSQAARAWKTAELVAEQLKFDKDKIVPLRDLYDTGLRGYLEAVNKAPAYAESVILFGHNPDISYFAEYLSGANIGSIKKAGIVVIEFEGFKWSEVSGKTGKFISYTTPRDVRGEH